MPLTSYFSTRIVRTWQELLSSYEDLSSVSQKWMFRGQSDCTWTLRSSLDRAADEFCVDSKHRSSVEAGLLRQFQRKCHQYVDNPPHADNKLEWLALMQHFGAPTRLLDWTYSYFVALHFAIESLRYQTKSPALWAIDAGWLGGLLKQSVKTHRSVSARLDADPALLQEETVSAIFFGRSRRLAVGGVTPHLLNERLVLQQGTFLCPMNVRETFAENLRGMLANRTAKETRKHCVKLILDLGIPDRKNTLWHLHKMNISRATLFPGIGGFAEALANMVANHEVLLDPGDP